MCTMNEIQLLVFLPLLSAAYNLNVGKPIIYSPNPSKNGIYLTNKSFFGYNVLLYGKQHKVKNGSSIQESWLIVGAPKANYTSLPDHENIIPKEPGVVYRCPLRASCVPINITNPDDVVGFIDQVGLNTLIEKGNGWLGAAMSLHDSSGTLTVCAPRTIVRIYSRFAVRYQNTMHGVCYTGELSSGSLNMEDKNFSTFNFTSTFWYNPMNGFAVHYMSSQAKMHSPSIYPVIGSPKHELYGSVHKMGQLKPTELPISDDLTQFGYALTSGYYFHEDQLMVAGGAPGWQYVGQVAIMDPRTDPLSIIVTINGKEIGEFFGASLATGDLNKDGLDDLIVGAPHWKNDNGRVHIFLGNKAGFFEADILLEGGVNDALYGYAITCGDIDGDRFDDIVVGAPWEESGVIYVYNGGPMLHDVKSIEPSQRIAASDINRLFLRFGFSLAKPADADGNGFLDVAVGAYASGHAAVLLSRPVLRTELTVSTIPTTLPRNSTKFLVRVCVRHILANEQLAGVNFHCAIDTDEDYGRVANNKIVYTRFSSQFPEQNLCETKTLYLKKGRNFIDAIDIIVTHRLLDEDSRLCKPMCPIEYRGARSIVVRTKLPFDIGCGMDDICQAFIFAKMVFLNARNSTWTIGSEDLSLVLLIGNHGEPSYLTTVTLHLPKGIALRSILPSCQEEENENSLKITCDVGNPLGSAMEKRVILDLDMNRLHNGSADGTKLNFRADIKTRSVNRGAASITIPLHLKANVSVALSGKSYDDNYYLNNKNEKHSNVTFQHMYQIARFGATPIFQVRLIIQVPYKFGNYEYLKLTKKPRVSILGRFYECSVSNVSVAGPRISIEKTTDADKFEDMVHLDTFANRTRSRRANSIRTDEHLLVPRTDTISHVRLTDSSRSNDSKYNMQSELDTIPEPANADIIHLNCSNPDVECGLITCIVTSLKTSQDVGQLQLQLVFDTTKLTDESKEKEKVIQYVTDAWLDVISPTMRSNVPGTQKIVSVTTIFHRAPIVGKVSIWIIVGSVLLGLCALFVLAIILRKIGFFKRDQKNKLETMKSSETISLNSDLASLSD